LPTGFSVLEKRILAPAITRLEVEAPLVAAKACPGQFIVLRLADHSERIPLTVAEKDPRRGTISLIFQAIGKSTRELAALEPGDRIRDLVGPLGQPSLIENFGRVAAVAGGLGIAFIYPEIRALAEAGNRVTSILGARSADLLFLVEEIEALSDRTLIATDDGSRGRRGLATEVLAGLLEKGERFARCLAVGPLPMMKAACALTRHYELPTEVSLDPIVVDGSGMCGSCRVTVGGETKFACVDGPNFDGHQVDFDELAARKRTFHEQEQCSLDRYLQQAGRRQSP
jgi:ferredoxin--NADP+ reductase